MLRSPVIDERSKRAVRYYCDVCLCFRTEWLAGLKNDCWPHAVRQLRGVRIPLFSQEAEDVAALQSLVTFRHPHSKKPL